MRPLLLIFLSAALLVSQTTTSTLTGVVQDSSGGTIPGAKVQVVNEASGVAVQTETNAIGLYRVSSLIPGAYRVEVESNGFQRLVRRGVTVQISQTLQLDLTLQVGSVQETINVVGAAPLVESQSSSTGQLVEREMVAGMPMPNRSSTALIALTPGATIQNVGGEIPIFSVGGGRMRNQQFTMDGGNHTNTVGLAVNQSQVPLPMDAMQEFRIITNNYSAEYGQTSGGVVTLATRSGTNDFHGSLFEYTRNEAFDARNFFAARRPKFRQHQFGGTFGGPIRKDRTHFFASYERTQLVTGATAVQTVPTGLQRQGDFSQTLSGAGQLIRIYDPATTSGNSRQPFPGNVIPAARLDPVARNIMAFWPQPNQAGAITGANNFSLNTRPSENRDTILARVDHQFNDANQLMVRYFISDRRTRNPGIWPEKAADPSASGTDQRTHNILGTWTRILRTNFINEFRLGLVRRDFFNQRLEGRDENLAADLGLQGVSGAAFPIIAVTGFTGMSGAPFRFSSPLLDYQVQNSISWFRGKHALKAGFEVRYGVFNDDTDTSSSGNFSFIPQITGLPGNASTGNALASFLLGEVNAANVVRPDPIRSRASYWAAYLQDDWRVTSNLTLNLGLRWETTLPRITDDDRMNSFDTAAINPVSGTPGVVTFAGRNGVPRRAYDTDLNNFGPRVGFAWQVPALRKTVVRSGAGFIYGASVNEIVGTAATLGFSTDFRITATQVGIDSAMRLRDGFPSFVRQPVEELGAGFGAVPVGRSPNTAVTFFERNRPTPLALQYNFNVQHEIFLQTLLEIGYIGNLSHHLPSPAMSINQVPPSQLGPGNAQVRRPFPQFSNVNVLNPPLGNSSYHAGIIKIERRFTGGFSLLAHYTFSKFIDDVQSFTELGDTGSYMDFYNRRLDRGLSGSHVSQRGVISGVYELPMLRNRGLLTLLLGGWKSGVIASMQTGSVFTVFSSVNQTNAFPAGTLRADLVGDPKLPSSERSLSRWFNTEAFAIPQPFQFGTAGRSILEGPGLINFDVSFIKSFPIRERFRLELRAEFFNFFNRANFELPGHSLGAPNFGIISSAEPGRRTQLALRVEF
ncbi:MAG: TonB-dependent receptor domain-containing protein [Bryobacteraceae bacterium]